LTVADRLDALRNIDPHAAGLADALLDRLLAKGAGVTPAGGGTPELQSARDLMKRFGVSSSTFYELEKRGHFRHLEVKRPVGVRRYSRRLVDLFLAGESTVAFGRHR
jgi:hypothetical protein